MTPQKLTIKRRLERFFFPDSFAMNEASISNRRDLDTWSGLLLLIELPLIFFAFLSDIVRLALFAAVVGGAGWLVWWAAHV